MPEPTQRPQSPLLTLRELAAFCRVDLRTVQRWLQNGELNADRGLLRLPGGLWRIEFAVFHAHLHAAAGASQLELPLGKPAGLRLVKTPKHSRQGKP